MTQPISSTRHRWRTTRTVLLLAALLGAGTAIAAPKTTQPPLEHVTIDLSDRAAVRDGALYFAHRCSACHGLQGARYSELATPLGLSRKQIQRYFNTTGRRYSQTIVSSMPDDVAKKFLDKKPPDLTVIAARRSPDWLYTYLTSFYLDPSRPTGANNVVLHNVAMPDVFTDLQGLQAPVKEAGYRNGSKAQVAVGVKALSPGALTHAQFDTVARDLVTFLDYTAHPHAAERHALGRWVLAILAGLAVLCYLLYRAWWRRVVPPSGPRWWRYVKDQRRGNTT